MTNLADTATAVAALSTGLPDDRPMDARAGSAFLTKIGFPLAPATLARLRCAGGGPTFLKYGSRVLYRPSALREWVDSRTRELRNTSESQAA